MTRIYIAEKPSLARAIADALPTPHRKHEGYIEVAGGDLVTWCFGHLLEQVEPHVYDDRFKRWNLADLPIVPLTWRLAPRKSAKKQLAIIRRLLKNAGEIVHAGDPDREGQLLVDELLGHVGLSAAKHARVQRLLIRDLNIEAVTRALSSLRPNSEFAPLSASALARSRADWLFGINMTRAYTLLGQKVGHKGVLSVGRVQTPVLGLVVRRDAEIADFISRPFYKVHALIPHEGRDIEGEWQPSEACAAYQDDEGRVVHRPLAENVSRRIQGQPATVLEAKHAKSKKLAPLPYSLSALQIDAAKRFGLSAAAVLAACQELYETHKLITYPRSDCRYLPEDHLAQSLEVCRAVASNQPNLAFFAQNAHAAGKPRAFDDKKVGAHHAIIPTPVRVAPGALSAANQHIYGLICKQYLMQFAAAAMYADARLVFDIGGGRFVAKGRVLLKPGWRALLLKESSTSKKPAPKAAYVPVLKPKAILVCREGRIADKQTEAPKPFTDATLLQAMTGIGRFVDDTELRKVLRETDGLGTEATRAAIIEGLFQRRFLERQRGTIRATDTGRALIAALPRSATAPDMTAQWERKLRDMAEGRCALAPFLADLEQSLRDLLEGPCRGEVPASLRRLR